MKLFENALKEYFFYAPPHDNEDDEEDTIIGYIAAVRDYQTKKTKYIDDDGNVCDSKPQAKVFDTKGKADNYSYEYCPDGWAHFVVAIKKSDILNESDNKYKAKVTGKGWLKGDGFVDDENEADTFESKTEPTQRINQMKKDGKLNKNAEITTKKLNESLETYADIINLKYDLIDEHKDVWGDNTADRMDDIVIRLGDTHGKGLAASGILKNGKIGIIISPICAAFAKEDIDNIVLHELAHCAVYFAYGSFCKNDNGGHNEDWHYYVDQLNEKGYDIREVVDDSYLDEIEERMDKLQEMTSEEYADSAARAHHVYGYDFTPLWQKQGRRGRSLYDYDPEKEEKELKAQLKAEAKKDRQERWQKVKNFFFGPSDDELLGPNEALEAAEKELKGPDTPKMVTHETIEDALNQWYEYQLEFNSNFSKERTTEAYEDICNLIKESDGPVFNLINQVIHKIEWYGYDSWQFEKNIHDTLKESAVATKYMACCYDPDDYYEETNYVDEDGELSCNSSRAKLFDTEEEAEEWAYDNKPYDWVSFAMPCNSTLDEATIPQAKRFATRKHGERNQVRKATGAPYIVHPEGVAALVKEHGGDDEQIQAAWLHDTMEDTGTWKDDLTEKFGDRVANIVAELTNDDYAIRSLGSKEDYMNQKLCHLSHDALLVKLCDMLYNHEDFPPMQQKMRIEKNIHYLMQNRELNENEWQICNKIVSGD